ncbi:MAG: O-antigen ligase family protein, partial [Alphaproteobacteria bacterium]|nr:O-antigen ligase family protein [Alphaproteobacteria bacterium]
ILRASSGLFAALAFPLFACYSAFWSDVPPTTLYHGAELLTLAMSGVIMARTVRTKPFVKGLLLGTCIVMCLTLASGVYDTDYFTKARALTGYFGSKNEVGFFAEIGIFLSLLMLAARTTLFEKLVFILLPLGLCAVCLALSKSATSIASLAMMLGLCALIHVITRLPRALRALALTGAVLGLVTCGLVIIAARLDIVDKALAVFGKDPTLTGRTYLWSEGIKNGLLHPFLGYGYTAFWVPGRSAAEWYWHEFFITDETGFHFHNLFIQTFVDLGLCGALLMMWMLLAVCMISFSLVWRRGVTLETGLAFGLAFLFLFRSPFEVDTLGPYGMGPLLFFWLVAFCKAGWGVRRMNDAATAERTELDPRKSVHPVPEARPSLRNG